MFEMSIFPGDTLRTNAALYGCSLCPPPEGCPDDPDFPPVDHPILLEY